MNTNINRLLAICGILALHPGALLADFQHTTGSNESYYVQVSVPCCAHYHQHGTAYGDSSNYIRGYGPLGGFDLCAPQYLDLSGEIAAASYDLYQEVGGEGYVCVEISWSEEPANPFQDVDENGVGSLGQFGMIDRSESLPSAAEWLGMAVGIFVEPVDWFMTAVEIFRDPTNPWAYVGIIPGIPAGVGKLVKRTVSITTDVLRNLPYGKVLKMGDKTKGLDHILRRHAHKTPGNAGKFLSGMHQSEIAQLLSDALDRPGGVWRTEGPLDIYEVVMPNVIGVAAEGPTTRKLRIVVGNSGDIANEVITAYPILE